MAETIVVELTREEAVALADHPATLQPDDPGLFWVQTVKRAVAKVNAALAEAQGA